MLVGGMITANNATKKVTNRGGPSTGTRRRHPESISQSKRHAEIPKR